jgi:hypothetical protein
MRTRAELNLGMTQSVGIAAMVRWMRPLSHVIASGLGCGMALGAAVSLIWRPRRAGWTNCLGAAALALPDPLMAAGAPLPVVMAAVVVAACGLSMSVVAWQTAIRQHVPADQQGRVSAFTGIAEIGLTPIGYLPVLPVTGAIGVRGTLLACGIILAAANLAPLLSGGVRDAAIVWSPVIARFAGAHQSTAMGSHIQAGVRVSLLLTVRHWKFAGAISPGPCRMTAL